MLRRFQIPYLERRGYINMRCAWTLGCPAEIEPLTQAGHHKAEVHAGGDYKTAFEELFPSVKVPELVGVSCCAQFAVTKEKVRERPRSEYARYRRWLLETNLPDSISGRIMEYSWHSRFQIFYLLAVLGISMTPIRCRQKDQRDHPAPHVLPTSPATTSFCIIY